MKFYLLLVSGVSYPISLPLGTLDLPIFPASLILPSNIYSAGEEDAGQSAKDQDRSAERKRKVRSGPPRNQLLQSEIHGGYDTGL